MKMFDAETCRVFTRLQVTVLVFFLRNRCIFFKSVLARVCGVF